MIATIFINGIIGEPSGFESGEFTSLNDVKRQFESFSNIDSLTVYINSVGGDAREGFAIRDYLRSQGKPVTTIAEGKVYSIASVIFLAGDNDKRFVRPHAEILIHNPFPPFGTHGDADEHEKALIALRSLEDELANFYATYTSLSFERAKELMTTETRIKGEEAVSLGFASGIMEELQAVALFNTNQNPKSMSNHSDELKGLKKILSDLGVSFKNQSEEKPPEKVEETPKTDEAPDLQARITELEAELEAANANTKEVIKKNEALAATEATQSEAINQFRNQFVALEKQIQGLEAEKKELESTPIIQTEKKEPTYTNKAGKSVNYPADVMAHLNQITTNFNNR